LRRASADESQFEINVVVPGESYPGWLQVHIDAIVA